MNRINEFDRLVGERVKSRRIALGMSQIELANAVDVSIQQVQKYERATNRISSGRLYIFAQFLKVPISYFYDQKEIGFDINDKASEREFIALAKAFGKVKNDRTRSAIIELVKSLEKKKKG